MSSSALNAQKEKIKLVVFDVDGVLTDGTLSYSASGEAVKHFNVKDGVGIKLLQTYGVDVAVISAKTSEPLTKRMSDLGVKHFFPATTDKLKVLLELMSVLGIQLDEVAYAGDDVIDLKVMQKVGVSFAPSDAFWMVKKYATLELESAGGKGVAREVCDHILSAKMDLEEAYIKAMLPEFESKDFAKLV